MRRTKKIEIVLGSKEFASSKNGCLRFQTDLLTFQGLEHLLWQVILNGAITKEKRATLSAVILRSTNPQDSPVVDLATHTSKRRSGRS